MRAPPYSDGNEGQPESWKQVLVLEMRDGVAYVDPLEGESTELLGPGT